MTLGLRGVHYSSPSTHDERTIRQGVHLSETRTDAPIRIGLCGLGSIGGAVARLLIEHREGHEIVGVATKEPELIGRRLNEALGLLPDGGPVIVGNLEEMLSERPEVVAYSTGSFLRETADDIVAIARAGASIVSPCEELAFPYKRFPEHAKRIDDEARAAGVTILGTGVNPGFIFDSLLVTTTGVCWDISAIRGRRVVDVSGFGENIHLRLGIGYTQQEFDEGHSSGQIAGHVGFPESIEMLCERIGLGLDGPVQETFEPMIAETPAPARYGHVDAGRTEGFVQRAIGEVDGEARVQLELLLHLRPRAAGFEPSDTIEIDGIHPVRLTLKPGMDAIPATAAELVNSIPGLLHAEAGLKSVKDLPAAAAWLGDSRSPSFR